MAPKLNKKSEKDQLISDKYKKLSGPEHVLARPGMYIGSIEEDIYNTWIFDFDEDDKTKKKMIKKTIKYIPGLYKIFDEILVNAIDHAVRVKGEKEAGKDVLLVKNIHVNINKETGIFEISNDGQGIEIVKHPEHNIYIPELIFGNMLTSTNYDDSEEKIIGGTNGLGSKCLLESVKINLFNGEIKLAKDIKIGDILIGDDGNKRTVLNITTGTGKMYEINQTMGEKYTVNDEHILTLHIPDHKVIFWSTNGWRMIWWNNKTNSIKTKQIKAIDTCIKCDECDTILSGNIKRHYTRCHPDKKVPVKPRKSPTKNPDMNNENIKKAFNKMQKFAKSIDNNNIIDISIKDYLKLSKTTQSRLAGLRGNCVNWEYKPVELDPYVLGLWLGDGTHTGYSYTCDGENDCELINYLIEWGKRNDAKIKRTTKHPYVYGISSIDNFHKKGYAPLRKLLKKYDLVSNKHIPKEYIINSREVRMNVLAGLIDTDGTLSRDGTRIGISQGLCHKTLIYDALYLARSLGFYCTINKYKAKYTWKGEKKESDAYKLNISGNIDDIPTKLPRKICKTTKKIDTDKSTGQLKIKEIENGKYVGLKIDGNQRFLINDFTVTHNCSNIFSTRFEVETVDYVTKTHYHQVFENNMSIVNPPKIEKYKKKPDITTIFRFKPDYPRFNMPNGLTDDMYDVIIKRVYDTCAVTDNDVNVYLNNEKLEYKNFEKYIDLFLGPKIEHDRVYERINERWEIAASYNDFNGFEQMSFVNGLWCLRGGKHVEYICNQIVKKLTDLIVKKNKNVSVKPQSIKDNLILFVKSTIVNPSFDSQSKETLTTPATKFGSKGEVSDKFIEKLYKSGIVEKVLEISQLNDAKTLQKTDGKKKSVIRGLPKLEDANWAGTNKSSECILILTEGDSTTGDTPLLLRHNNIITIKTIETISNNINWIENNGKEYNKTDYEVWTEKGWTKINHVFRHKVSKKIFRILTHTGVVDVTEDHSLIKKNGIEISPKDCIINDELLHSFPSFKEHKILFPNNWEKFKIRELWILASQVGIQYYQSIRKKPLIEKLREFENSQNNDTIEFNQNDNKLTEDEAYVMGLFFADGSCGVIKNYWKINNCNTNFLEKCSVILKNLYPDYLFEIMEDISSRNTGNTPLYALVARKPTLICKEFIKNYRELFYDNFKKKKVPDLILNATFEIRQSFFNGFYDGDGQKYHEYHIKPSNELRIDFDEKIGAHGIYFLAKSLGYNVSINIRSDKPKVYRLNLTKGHQQDNPCRIKKIWDMGITEQYVYDLETENHHFQAGVGQMIVHNSAATMAITGLSEVGRDRYGVFPLKGKMMNVKDTNIQKIVDNDEITNLKKIIGLESNKEYKENVDFNSLRYGSIMVMTDQDSVTGDTPVLLRKNGKIYIEAIERISTNWVSNVNGKEYGDTNDFEIWNDNGWTKIVHVMKHKVTKNIYRVLTHTGIVDVTEDHSLLNIHGDKITPKECFIGNELLHSFPKFDENKIDIPDNLDELPYKDICKLASSLKIQYYQTKRKDVLISAINNYKLCNTEKLVSECDISSKEAFVMGLFWADGSCGIYTWQTIQKKKDRPKAYTFNRTSFSWAISNNDISLLEKSQLILEEIYKDIRFSIIENRHNSENRELSYKLIANGGIKTKYLIDKYLTFYYKTSTSKYKNGNKIVPMYILNSPRIIREQFLEGYYCGDGSTHDINNKSLNMDVESKISCQSIFYLCKSLGYEVSINHLERKPTVYTLNITKGHQQDNPNRIKKIWNLGKTEQYVYDLETENHHFQAGVGQICIHNTDGSHCKSLLFNVFHTMWPTLIKCNKFMSSLLTPIVKAKNKNQVIQFYSLTDYEKWKKEHEHEKGWDIKYYKGLGTSDDKEAVEYFRDMKKITYFVLNLKNHQKQHLEM